MTDYLGGVCVMLMLGMGVLIVWNLFEGVSDAAVGTTKAVKRGARTAAASTGIAKCIRGSHDLGDPRASKYDGELIRCCKRIGCSHQEAYVPPEPD